MIESRVQEFAELAFEKQKEKMIAMLSELKDDEWFFQKVLKVVQGNDKITSEILVGIYQDILEFAEEIKKIDKEWQLAVIQNIKNKMDRMRAQEEIEREEESPDNLLENI